jgi:WD40 repeat protein
MISSRYWALALLFLCLTVTAPGQRLTISRIDTSGYPTIRGYLYALDAAGNSISGLSAGDFAVTENGAARQILSINCPSPHPVDGLSSVLTIDVSGSMAWSAQGQPQNPNIALARAAANAWVAGLPAGSSECAISTFDEGSLINQDFTDDKSKLFESILALQPQGGTNYNAGLIGSPAGGITIAAAGKRKRVVVFLTDGRGGGDENAIVETAAANSVTVFVVTLGMPAPDILKNVAHRTGGEYFENVTTVEDAQGIYRAILYRSLGGEPCELVWQSDPGCSTERNVSIAIPSRSLSASMEYIAPLRSLARIELDPPSLIFGRVEAGASRTLNVTMSAPNRAVTVRSIEPLGARAKFSLEGATVPFTLAAGERKSFTVRYTASDTSFASARWRIESDACVGSMLFASAGTGGRPEPSIHLIKPNGGEVFHAGEQTTISWEGVLPGDTVRLDYSTDAGATWRQVEPRTAGLAYRWTVPATPSDRCLARVSQLGSGGTTTAPTIRKPRNKIFALSPDGQHIATATGGDNDTVTVWNIGDGAQVQTFPAIFSRFEGMGNMVRLLEYSPDGKTILVETEGGKVHLLDPAGARIVRSIDGATLTQVNNKNSADNASAFSPDGSRILLSASSDLVPGVWDARTGRKISSLKAEGGAVYAASFTPDGKQVITTGKEGTAQLWDAATGNLVQTFKHPKSSVAIAVAPPDGGTLATTADRPDDSVRIWNRSTGELLSRLYMGGDASEHVPLFTPDGSLVLLWPNGVPTLADARSGSVIRRFVESDGAARNRTPMYATFSPDGSMLATYGFSGITIWDVATGRIIKEFEHKGTTIGMRARCVAEGSAMAWSFGEYTEIGGIEPGAIQEDRSDNLWTIVVDSRPAALDVDFGRKQIGATTDSLVTSYIRNEGTGPLRVDDIAINGAYKGDFSLVSGIPPFEIAPGGSRPVEFRFIPSGTGMRTATADIIAGGRIFSQNLRGEGVRPQLRLETPRIDFGETVVGERRDTVVGALLRNNGSTPVTVSGITMLGPDTTQFAVVEGGGSFTLAPGEEHPMTIRFRPGRLGRTSTRLAFNHNGFGSRAVAELYGRGVLPGEEELFTDPTTFRSIAVPNAILPKKGSIVGGSYDLLGLMAGYAVTDNVMVLAGGGVPLPDDWGGVKGSMYGAYSVGIKAGLPVTDRLNIAAGFQWGRSMYDQEATPDVTESIITVAAPYGAISYGDDDSRISATFGYAFKHHDTPAEQFDRQAGILAIGGDFRFAERWKVVAEGFSMRTLGYIPVMATARYFGHTWAFDFGLAYLGIGDGPALKVAPVLSFVKVW